MPLLHAYLLAGVCVIGAVVIVVHEIREQARRNEERELERRRRMRVNTSTAASSTISPRANLPKEHVQKRIVYRAEKLVDDRVTESTTTGHYTQKTEQMSDCCVALRLQSDQSRPASMVAEKSASSDDIIFSVSSTPTLVSRASSPACSSSSALSATERRTRPSPAGTDDGLRDHQLSSMDAAMRSAGSDCSAGSTEAWDVMSDAGSDWSHIEAVAN